MTSVAKSQAVLADTHELVQRRAFASLLRLQSQFVEPQRIKTLGLGEQLRVEADGNSGNLNGNACRNDLSVVERKGLKYFSLEGSCMLQ